MMKGLDLAKAFFEEEGLPMLREKFPDKVGRIAAGLVGEGSQCFGFDDEISRDHDFDASFCLWITGEDGREWGAALEQAYASLPSSFRGVPRAQMGARAGDRTGVLGIRSFYFRYLGIKEPPQTNMEWMRIPEENLALVTNGEVFTDPLGEFTRWREALLAYYPEDVRIKKIAAKAAEMARTGQYNYGRAMRRGEVVTAQIALSDFLKHTMGMLYLLNKKYAPYYKWMYRGLETLESKGTVLFDSSRCVQEMSQKEPSLLTHTLPLIKELALAPDQSSIWAGEHGPEWNPYTNTEDEKVQLIEEICALTVSELKRQELTSSDEPFLENQTWEIMRRIKDPEIARMHVLA